MGGRPAVLRGPNNSCTTASPCDPLMQEAADRLRQAGIDRPLFEAQVLLAHVLGISRGELIARWPVRLGETDQRRWEALVVARTARIPMAYVKGWQEFYGIPMKVSPDVLVPRPETELLVELALAEARRLRDPVVVDACTGSGCIAAALAHHLSNARMVATDISPAAMQIARENMELRTGGQNALLVTCSTVRALRSAVADIVTANPPYIPSSQVGDLQPEVRDYEPRLALDGGHDGLMVMRELLPEALRVLKPGGLILMEVALGQSEAAAELMTRIGYVVEAVHRDLAGIPRAIEARRPSMSGLKPGDPM